MIVFGMKVLQKVATTPMRKSVWEPEACFFAYTGSSHECVHVGAGQIGAWCACGWRLMG